MSVPSERNSYYWFPQNTFIILVGSFASFTKFWKFVGMTIYFIDSFCLFFSHVPSPSIVFVSLPLRYPWISQFVSIMQGKPFFNNFNYWIKKKKKDAKALPCKGPSLKNFCVCWNVCGYSWQSDLSSNYKYNTITSQVIYKHIWRMSSFSFLTFIFICPSIHCTLFSLPGLKLY